MLHWTETDCKLFNRQFMVRNRTLENILPAVFPALFSGEQYEMAKPLVIEVRDRTNVP
jgi:hypothetical protein